MGIKKINKFISASEKANNNGIGELYIYGDIADTKWWVEDVTPIEIKNALDKRCPVKTEKSIPKELNFKLMDELKNIELIAPVKRGDIVIKNVFNTGVDVVVTKDM